MYRINTVKKESELLRFRTCNSHFGRDKTFISVQIKFIVRFTGYDERFIPLRKPNKPQFLSFSEFSIGVLE